MRKILLSFLFIFAFVIYFKDGTTIETDLSQFTCSSSICVFRNYITVFPKNNENNKVLAVSIKNIKYFERK